MPIDSEQIDPYFLSCHSYLPRTMVVFSRFLLNLALLWLVPTCWTAVAARLDDAEAGGAAAVDRTGCGAGGGG